MKISKIHAREILDSRGNPTVEVDVLLEGGVLGRAAVPSGASTGVHEALELRDKDPNRYLGKGVSRAVENVNTVIQKALVGKDASKQTEIDRTLLELDGTPNKSKLGANAILGVSMACAYAAAKVGGKSLFEYVAIGKDSTATLLPTPMMNILNGGQHADNPLDIQEFMIMPTGFSSFRQALQASVEVFQTLKGILGKRGLGVAVGDEGGFAPQLYNSEEALELIVGAIEKANYKVQRDFVLALDVASSELYKEGKYHFQGEGTVRDPEALVAFYEKLVQAYPIVSIEDGCAEDDWEGWKLLTKRLGDKVQLVGDDVFVTNVERIQKGIQAGVANAVLIKVNQIGTLTETWNAISTAKQAGYRCIMSHRSGETEDVTISHLAVGWGVGQIKTGSLCRSDRVAKYNELLRIEEALGPKAQYAGKTSLQLVHLV